VWAFGGAMFQDQVYVIYISKIFYCAFRLYNKYIVFRVCRTVVLY